MKIIHQIGRTRVTGEGTNHFLLTNKKGNYLALGSPNLSDFDGLHHYSSFYNSMLKLFSDIKLSGTPDTIINHFSFIERRTGAAKEKFYLSSNALIYEVENYEGDLFLTLDIKKMYDDSTEGRYYNSYIFEGKTFFEYTKVSNNHEDYKLYLIINNEGELLNNWKPIFLAYDAERNMPRERYVFDALKIRVNKKIRLIITFSHDKKKALEKLDYVSENEEDIISAIKKSSLLKLPHQKKDFALLATINSLDLLITKLKNNSRGIYAGLPWFHQTWARDELFCLKALILQKQYLLVKEIITKYFELFSNPDNTLSLNGADIPGLLCLRTFELLTNLTKNKLLNQYFSKMELNYIKEKTLFLFEKIKSKEDLHGFINNDSKDTWMDTITPLDEGRPGARIEIQSLYLAVYDLLDFFGIKKDTVELKRLLREWFWNKGRILDGFINGSADERVRPNIFLAWYYYPDLFNKQEWESAFDFVLQECWLEWGGLSSISKKDQLFLPSHSGLGDASYHRGDSWFFINNVAALAMFTLNPHKYESYIEKIRVASENDLLYQGYLAHASEISDAIKQNARGCWSQAWSSATLYELILKMRHNI